MLVAFIGTHIPLLGLIGYVAFSKASLSNNLAFLVLALISTVVGMGVTLWILAGLLKPVEHTSHAMDQYISDRELPDLPTRFDDQAGILMANMQAFIQRLDQLLGLKNDLISIISHDAKTPISSILLAEELIEEELEDQNISNDTIEKNAGLIRKSAEQHMETLENMMEMAKIEGSEFEITLTATNLASLFEEIEKTHNLRVESQNITLTFNADGVSQEVAIDRPKIKSVLNNLVSNAIKFTPSGGTVSVEAHQKNGTLILSVSDTGMGIEESDLDDIFSRDYTTPSPFEKKSGSGLGLWICKHFVELHGGDITVESEPDEGSTFTICIPVAE